MSVKSSIRNFNDVKYQNGPIVVDTVNLSMQLNHISKMLEDSVMKFTKRYLIVATELEEMKREFVGQSSLINEYITLTKKEIRFDKFDKFQQGKGMLNVPLCPNYEQKCLVKKSTSGRMNSAKTNKYKSNYAVKKNVNRLMSPQEGKKVSKNVIKNLNDSRSINGSNYSTINNNKRTPLRNKNYSTDNIDNLQKEDINLNLVNKKNSVKQTNNMNNQEKKNYHKSIINSIKNTKIKALYTMVTQNDILQIKEKLKAIYLNKELLSNIVVRDVMEDSGKVIKRRIEQKEKKFTVTEEEKELINKLTSYPSKTAQTGLNFLTNTREKDIINTDDSSSIELCKMIFACLGEGNFDEYTTLKDAYENLFNKYNVKSIKKLFSDVIYKKIYYDILSDSPPSIDISNVIQCIDDNRDLITDSLANSTNKTFSYIAFSLEEIADYLKEVEAINDEQEMKKKLKQQIEINKMKIEYERIKEIVN